MKNASGEFLVKIKKMNWTTNSTGTFAFYATEQSGSSWADIIAELDMSEGHREFQETQAEQYMKFKENDENLFKFESSDKLGVIETGYYLLMGKLQKLKDCLNDSEKSKEIFNDIAIISTITASVCKKK